MNILLIKTSSLGDIVHIYPVLSYLKREFPHCRIDFVVEKPFSELVLKHPLVDKVIIVETKKWRKSLIQGFKGIRELKNQIRQTKYDVSFDLQGNLKSGLIQSLVKSNQKVGFGFKTANEKVNCFFNKILFNPTTELNAKELNVRDENLFIVKEYFKRSNFKREKQIPLFSEGLDEPLLKISDEEKIFIAKSLHASKGQALKVVVAPGSFWKNKQLDQETLKAFLEKVKQKMNPTFFFIWGNEKELQFVRELKDQMGEEGIILSKMSLAVLQNFMSRVDLVIAMDSLPLHLAGTTRVSTFSFFGPSRGAKFAPVGKAHHFFQGSCPYGRDVVKRCKILRSCRTGACLKDVSVSDLLSAFLNK